MKDLVLFYITKSKKNDIFENNQHEWYKLTYI